MTDPCDLNELELEFGNMVDGLLWTVLLTTDPCPEATDPPDGVRKRSRLLAAELAVRDVPVRVVPGLSVPPKWKSDCLSTMGVIYGGSACEEL